jgi:predicted HAD superfamily phosphohydrolase YqeG
MATRRSPVPGLPRTSWYVVDDLADAVAVAADHTDTLVVDLENTLVDYGSTVEERQAAMDRVLDAAAGTALRRLAFVSNARFALPAPEHASLMVTALAAARKPHLVLPPLRRFRAELAGAAVYGDQPLTDGMLARNLGGIWLQPRHAYRDPALPADRTEPWWPRVMRSRGRRALRERFELVPPRRPASSTAPR